MDFAKATGGIALVGTGVLDCPQTKVMEGIALVGVDLLDDPQMKATEGIAFVGTGVLDCPQTKVMEGEKRQMEKGLSLSRLTRQLPHQMEPV